MAAEVGGWEEVQKAEADENQDFSSCTESKGINIELKISAKDSEEKKDDKLLKDGEEEDDLQCRHRSSDSDTKSNGSGNHSDNSSKSTPQVNSKVKSSKKKHKKRTSKKKTTETKSEELYHSGNSNPNSGAESDNSTKSNSSSKSNSGYKSGTNLNSGNEKKKEKKENIPDAKKEENSNMLTEGSDEIKGKDEDKSENAIPKEKKGIIERIMEKLPV